MATLPWVGPERTVTLVGSRLPSGSESFARSGMTTGVSSGVVAESLTAAGGSFTGTTWTVTMAVSQFPAVSQTRYVNWSLPLKPAAGVYVTTPVAGVTDVVPCAGAEVTVTVVGSRLPSGSVSWARTAIATGVSSPVAAASFRASGGPSTMRTVG